MAATPPGGLSAYPASYYGEVITKYLEDNKLNVFKTEEIEGLQKTLVDRDLSAAKVVAEKDRELEKIKEEKHQFQKQMQKAIRKWSQAMINEKPDGTLEEDGCIYEDKRLDPNMIQLMKNLQTKVVNQNNAKVKEIQAKVKEVQGLQENKKVLLQNQSRLLAVIRDIAEFSEYPEPDRFTDHEERRMISQSRLTQLVDHLKNKIGENSASATSSAELGSSSSSVDLEQIKEMHAKERQETLRDINGLIEQNAKLQAAPGNLVTFVQNVAKFSGYPKKFEGLNANNLDKKDLDQLSCHVENLLKEREKRSPIKIARKRLGMSAAVVAAVDTDATSTPSTAPGPGQAEKSSPKHATSQSQDQGQQLLMLPVSPSCPPKAKSPTPPEDQVQEDEAPSPECPFLPPPSRPIYQPVFPSPPKRARQAVVQISDEESDEGEATQMVDADADVLDNLLSQETSREPSPSSSSAQAHVKPAASPSSSSEDSGSELGDKSDEEGLFACKPCKLKYNFLEDFKDHLEMFHENENVEMHSYRINDPERPSTSSGLGGSTEGFRKLPGSSIGRRVVVVAEEEDEDEQEVESTNPSPVKKKRKSAKIPATNRRATRTRRKISKKESSQFFYGKW